ncbi:MAG: hypothetical protein J2P50_17735 [Hyphomicrobiaceae bacterium]|nr:hypothetical protein [Hyphomicrobiaceae bacterium]
MAQRRAGKANRRRAAPRAGSRRGKAKSGAPKASPQPSDATLKERLAALERERDSLRAALEQERARRQALEKVHAATRDRIAWALDSLQAILDSRS